MTSVNGVVRTSVPFSTARRRSPSVKMPSSRRSSEAMVVIPRPLCVISKIASASAALGVIVGMSLPLTITSATRRSNLLPSAPPGWEKANSSAVKPLASRMAIASASPMTSAAVVLDVGARFNGQASVSTAASRCTSAACASSEVSLPVMLISGIPRRLIRGKSVRISCVLPLLERATTQSLTVIMPMSPWDASPGCTKKAGVPVLANVAAILPAICPLLPMPVTTTRPAVSRMHRQAAAKAGPNTFPSADTASASIEMVLCAESTKN